jgi:RNA polymerase sigma factor (sigma-70 family)
MHDATDMDLLRQYAGGNSDAAFAALVSRHVSLVYSAALRKAGNPHAAEEITQAVFIILAQKAGRIPDQTILPGWLYQTARLTAANFLKREIRRVRREQEAFMETELYAAAPDDEIWRQLAPLLEDAMGQLGDKDRAAVVLRFFGGKSFAEVAAAAGVSENAAKKRVGHALEKLRKFFLKRDIASAAETIAGAISAHSVQAAPVALAKSVTAAAIAKGAAASGSTLTLLKGALKIMAWTKAKTAAVAVAAVVVAVSSTTIVIKTSVTRKGQPQSNKVVLGPMLSETDSVTLQGTWSGWQIGDKTPGSALLIIREGKLEFHDANTNIWYKATYSLHENTVPKQTDILIADCFDRVYIGKTAHAIYKVADDKLIFAINMPGDAAMPESFDDQDANQYVFTRKQ